jgi:hypothetical protein
MLYFFNTPSTRGRFFVILWVLRDEQYENNNFEHMGRKSRR